MNSLRLHCILFVIILTACLPSVSVAQKMTVESMVPTTDQTANLSENLIQDNNGDYAGLVKVMLAAPNANFEGLVLKKLVHTASEHWVFMAKGSTRLKVTVPGYLPMQIDFRDYGINGIEPLRTYMLTITKPPLAQIGPMDDGMRYLAMKVEPKNCTVFVDGKLQQVDNGEVVVRVPIGSHSYQVMANGYEPLQGTVEVDDDKPLTIQLVSTRATLRVECATRGGSVFINDHPRGTVPWSGTLDAGNYKVEVRLDGYSPQQQSVTLAEKESRTLTFPALQMIVGSLSVDYRPIGSEVYVDGKSVGTTPKIFRNIPVGQHHVEIRKEGYQSFSQTVTIKENEQAEITGSLNKLAEQPSSSVINQPHSSEPSSEIYNLVEEAPSFPGGTDALYSWLSQNINYPKESVKKGTQGRVIVSFVIEIDGSISNVEVIKRVDSYIDDEAVRVVKLMPKWNPGKQNGQPLRVRYTLPITFKL